MPTSSTTPGEVDARDLLDIWVESLQILAGDEDNPTATQRARMRSDRDRMISHFRVAVLAEAIAAVEDPEQRRATGGGLGWESAQRVLHRLLNKARGGSR